MHWFIKLWHRLTLGRASIKLPQRFYEQYCAPGSVGAVAHAVGDAARDALPIGVDVHVCWRRAEDLPLGCEVSRENHLQWLREDEMRYRARGLFDMAVQVQRLADIAESGDPFPSVCCFVDRGTHPPIDGWLDGGMACVAMPAAGIVLVLTPDRAAQLSGALFEWLESFE